MAVRGTCWGWRSEGDRRPIPIRLTPWRRLPVVLAAELVAHYFPKLVELHNYSSANSLRQKLYNWATLNRALKPDAGPLSSRTCPHTRAPPPRCPRRLQKRCSGG